MAVPSTDRGAAANVAGPEKRHPVEFTADTGEYFRIWIVNLALSIVTLGIYSAWAKVRKRRYFYGHTRIDGEAFEYRANPLAILKGRLIAVAAIAVFYGVGYFAPLYQWLLWIPLLVGGPWLLVRSLAFNAYNTAYRNVRFRSENHRYGTTRFEVADFKKPFIGAYANAYGLGFVLIAALFGLGFAAMRTKSPLLFPGGVVLFYGGLFLLFAYVRARTTNAIWNAVRIGPLSFESALRARDMIWLYFSNLLAIAFTLGLATPWAVVRAMRYRASKTTVIASGRLDGFAEGEAQRVSVAGEEVAELFDIDIAL